MKVLMINGSRREKMCTYTALKIIADTLAEEGIESEIVFTGARAVNGEMNNLVKELAEKAKDADGLIVGSPVYYASPSGEVLALMDRLMAAAGPDLINKPGAAVCSARRAGTTASIDVLNKYFQFNRMPVVSSMYWNMVHGNTPEDVMKDEEGVQIMQMLGRNMAWLLKSIEAGRKAGIEAPVLENRIFTNFIGN